MAISIVPEWSKILTVLSDPEVSEVEVNEPDRVFIKKNGQRIRLNISFRDETYYMDSIEQGLVPLVTSLSPFSPTGFLFEGRLNYRVGDVEVAGRCHVVLPPSSDFPQITIAKKSASLKNIESIAAAGSMSTEMMQFLQAAVQAQLTIVFSGGTGAGKMVERDEMIPTASGMKRAADIKIGEVLFDERSERTLVVKKNSPFEKNFYRITFDDGTDVKVGGGHIWKVLELNEGCSVSGRKARILTQEHRGNILESMLSPDNMVTFDELMTIVSGDAHQDSGLAYFIRSEISGFGVTGGTLLMFNRNEILARCRRSRNREAQNVIKILEASGTDEVSLGELRSEMDGALSYEILGSMGSKTNHVFYPKNETLSYILDRDNDRLRGENPDQLTAIVSTDDIFEKGSHDSDGRVNFAVETIPNPVEFSPADLTVDSYLIGESLGRNLDESLPDEYLVSSADQRRNLIAGLMDTAGTFDGRSGAPVLTLSHREVASAARRIAASLGWNVSQISHSFRHPGVPESETFSFSFRPTSMIDLRRPGTGDKLKKFLKTSGTVPNRHEIVRIERIDGVSEDYYCFGVDSPCHTYLIGDTFIPTHNTTMLEALSKSIPDSYRIGVAEDVPELNLQQSNVTYLHSVPWQPGMDENDVATLAWVVQQFQRMRTDKIIIGETRGKEFADFLVAANSGMEGSMTTIHAENPERCLSKMTGFALKGSERQPIRAVNNDIANSVNLIVQLVIVDGKHRVSHIQEVTPTLGNTDEAKISTQPLYRWDREQDMFYKDAVMTDSMRQRMIDRHVPIDTFLHSQRELRQPSHGSTRREVQQQMSSGLPRGLPQRPAGGRSL